MISKILSTATALPRYSFSQEDSLAYVEKWVQNLPDRERRKILKIFQFAQVDKRYTVRDMDQMLRGESF
ncbi:MAG: type III polyketide synthase, partial [Bacteroidetes bacterium]|nr:type III polyketide synthase [Bacteroidota bacterium]